MGKTIREFNKEQSRYGSIRDIDRVCSQLHSLEESIKDSPASKPLVKAIGSAVSVCALVKQRVLTEQWHDCAIERDDYRAAVKDGKLSLYKGGTPIIEGFPVEDLYNILPLINEINCFMN